MRPSMIKSTQEAGRVSTRTIYTMSSSDTKRIIADWQEKLVGKVLSEEHGPDTFKRADLPLDFRVLKAGAMHTQEHNPGRMNVYCDKNMRVSRLATG
ncbi:hypothetical protein NEOLI_000346 [Neolecta irregularis DAH-3]|uniref:Uncharacterized protein n=1 Tax=Neolecta irregularis (strain DAH-3) TaxID=1198029 RepID=A0A1U7LVL3_NEOID|nr:hypothetical protein NEOLI_000346 [Neolecta irregularis DAH-3]|eukprot:OLL26715.1 hypothetical protein NEOLI_000346 [Neolecta irregularis DAH-3]